MLLHFDSHALPERNKEKEKALNQSLYFVQRVPVKKSYIWSSKVINIASPFRRILNIRWLNMTWSTSIPISFFPFFLTCNISNTVIPGTATMICVSPAPSRQVRVWPGWWASPCPATASSGTLSTRPPAWSPPERSSGYTSPTLTSSSSTSWEDTWCRRGGWPSSRWGGGGGGYLVQERGLILVKMKGEGGRRERRKEEGYQKRGRKAGGGKKAARKYRWYRGGLKLSSWGGKGTRGGSRRKERGKKRKRDRDACWTKRGREEGGWKYVIGRMGRRW